MASPAVKVRHGQTLERGLRAFQVWKVGKEGFFFSRQRELHDERYKDIEEYDAFDSIEHSEPVARDEDGDGRSQRALCATQRIWIACGAGSH